MEATTAVDTSKVQTLINKAKKQSPDALAVFRINKRYMLFRDDASSVADITKWGVGQLDNPSKLSLSTKELREILPILKSEGRTIAFFDSKGNPIDVSRVFPTVDKSNGMKARNNELITQYDAMKVKYPDAVLLFRVGDFYEAFKNDATKTSEILGVNLSQRKIQGEDVLITVFPHLALDTYLPKLVKAGQRVAICEPLEERVKKSENAESQLKKESDKVCNTVESIHSQPLDNKPLLTTPNGRNVTDAQVYMSKYRDDIFFFRASIDGKPLKPQRMSLEDAMLHLDGKTNAEYLMRTYYPSKMEVSLSAIEFKTDNKLSDGRIVDKFTPYKESNVNNVDYGKWKFYAKVGDEKMSILPDPKDMTAFFDMSPRATPAKLTEKYFGERLNLKSHYDQFKLPEGIDGSSVRISKPKNSKQFTVSVEVDDLGRTSKTPISYNDATSFFDTKTASAQQIAAKYLNSEIDNMRANEAHRSIMENLKY